MEKLICEVCGCQCDADMFFCSNCGKLLSMASLKDSALVSDAEIKLSRVATNLKEHPHKDILWNETVDAYSRKVEKIQSLLKIKALGIDMPELTKKIEKFLKTCHEPDFEIAFVGAVKAGKSTLINALLGKNYASTDPNPETAVLTKFRSSEQDYIKLKFYSVQEWDRLWKSVQKNAEKFLELYKMLAAEKCKDKWVGHEEIYKELSNSEIEDELKIWSSSQSQVHFFVKEIEVGISTLPKSFPKQVVFVDTPGLFDPVEFRSQISIDYIHSANAVLVCVKAEDLHGEEVKTVESVFSFSGYKRNKVFIIATNWDKLNNVVIDWKKRYKYMIDSFTGKAFFPTKEMAAQNIIYASAYHYNLCRDYENLRNSQKSEIGILLMRIQIAIEDCLERKLPVPEVMRGLEVAQAGMLTSKDIAQLMKVSNIERISNVIVTELIDQYKQLLYGDIKNLYYDIMHAVARVASERKKAVSERISISQTDLKAIEEKIEETRKNRDDIKEVQKKLNTALSNLELYTQKRMESITEQITEQIKS